MTTGTPVIQSGEAALLLRAKLGPIRAWSDFLADNIRGRQNIHGLTLKPCCRKKIGRAFRPMYAVADVEAFIAKVLELVPNAGKAPIRPIVLAVDRKRPWRLNKFDDECEPVAMLSCVYGYVATQATAIR